MDTKHANKNLNMNQTNERMYRSTNILGAFFILEAILMLAFFLFQILF